MYSDIASNKRKTVLIMFVFFVFLSAIIFIFTKYFGGNNDIFYGGMIGSLIYVAFTYYSGSKMALLLITRRRYKKQITRGYGEQLRT